MPALIRIFPFLRWFPLTKAGIKADFVAGLTVALLLVPQSMAYAQLAGLPPQYGLYTAFIPVIVAALFGWCHNLSSGPVAMTSLLFAAILGELAAPESAQYIRLAVLLGLLVGLVRLFLGLCRLAAVVNLLSHPVIVGFTNAGALIISLTQLNAILGVPQERKGHFLLEVAGTLARLDEAHLATLLFGAASIALILLLKRYLPRWPGVLIAVVLATALSWATGFGESQPAAKRDPGVAPVTNTGKLAGPREMWPGRPTRDEHGRDGQVAINVDRALPSVKAMPRIVGEIPPGPPRLAAPVWDGRLATQLLPGALLIAMVGFMEMLAASRAIAARTRQRLNLNQELIGQGLANIAGSFSGAYSSSGSLSRTALNWLSGGRTGLSSVFTGLCVLLLLLLLYVAPVLYYLPRATLAAAIIVAVLSLINVTAMRRAWQVGWQDGLAAVITFGASLAFAPHIYYGIGIGAGVALVLFMYNRLPLLKPAGDVRAAATPGPAAETEAIAVVRFAKPLCFINAARFEDQVFAAETAKDAVQAVLIAGEDISRIDATGEHVIRSLHAALRERGVSLLLSGLRPEVMAMMARTGLHAEIGAENFFKDTAAAFHSL